ncbi:Hypothetical protein FKW44_008984 [Caligus rogercresseyi]|uniref:Uncharacterized protein n=1 Tax=Caligus rogercresseyi TaxID=217165 RepID=A0A7T8HEQ6_CALRO|nr:Hypothetical protein FKW44_008984 [Caligus rogercresseyi]
MSCANSSRISFWMLPDIQLSLFLDGRGCGRTPRTPSSDVYEQGRGKWGCGRCGSTPW